MVPKLALFIDADNMSASHAEEILALCAQEGEVMLSRAFGALTAFSGKNGWAEALRQHGITARPCVTNIGGKNATDFALVIEAMDCMASGKFDGFVLASSDSDFTVLAQRLRNEGKMVLGIGDERAPVSFRSSCTRFVVLPDRDAPKEAPPKKKAPPLPVVPEGELQKMWLDIRKRKCKKRQTLLNWLVNNYKKSPEDAGKILSLFQARKYIALTETGKVEYLA